MNKRKRPCGDDNDDDDPSPKRAKVLANPISKVFGLSNLVTSVIARFLHTKNKVRLSLASRKLYEYLSRSAVAFAGDWNILNAYELPLPGEPGFDSLLARFPATRNDYLLINFPAPKPGQTLERACRALSHLENKCQKITNIALNCCDLSYTEPLVLDWQLLPRFRCEHVGFQSGVQISNVATVHPGLWSTCMHWADLVKNYDFILDSGVISVDLAIGKYDLDVWFKHHFRQIRRAVKVQHLGLKLGGVIHGEVDADHIDFWFLWELFPCVKHVYLSGATTRPVRWIEADVLQWTWRGIEVNIGTNFVATNESC